MGYALSLSLSLAESASAQSPPSYTLTPLGPYGGYADDLSEDGSIIVVGAGEPVRLIRLPNGSYQSDFLDPTRNVDHPRGPRTFFPFEEFRRVTVSDDGAVIAFAARDFAANLNAVYRWEAGLLTPLLVEDAVGPDRFQPKQAIVAGDGSRIFGVTSHVHDTNLGSPRYQ